MKGVGFFRLVVGGMLLFVPLFSAIFTVSNNGDSGAGSFRQAILDSNASGTSDTINFDVVGTTTLTSGLTITKASPLTLDINVGVQTITGSVTLSSTGDGTVTFNDVTLDLSAMDVQAGTLNVSGNSKYDMSASTTLGANTTLDLGGITVPPFDNGFLGAVVNTGTGSSLVMRAQRTNLFGFLNVAGDSTIGGTISGTGLPNMLGLRKMTLTQPNSNTLEWRLSQGILSISNENQLGTDTEFRFTANATDPNIEITNNATLTKTFNLEHDGGLVIPSGSTSTISGLIQVLFQSGWVITKTGDGTALLRK